LVDGELDWYLGSVDMIFDVDWDFIDSDGRYDFDWYLVDFRNGMYYDGYFKNLNKLVIQLNWNLY
jgi:hypothetical protein